MDTNPIPKGYDEAMVRRARQLRAEAMSVAEIARATGYSVGWVKKAVRGEPVPPALRRRYAKDAEREKAISMRTAGVHPRAIAQELGVHVTTVYEWTAAATPVTDVRRRQVARLEAKGRAEDEALRPRVLEMRRAGHSLRDLEKLLHLSEARIRRILGAEPIPPRLRRPAAKDGLRLRAGELRMAGQSIPDIARALQVSKSSAWEWTKHLSVPDEFKIKGGSARQRAARSAHWAAELGRREMARTAQIQAAFDEVGDLSNRELALLGAVLYWAEGAKSKPWQRREFVAFVNSDPSVIRLFMRWLALLGVEPSRLRFRVQIHESADVAAAVCFWAGVVGVPTERFGKTTLKRNNPKTNRRNRDNDQYHGCLTVTVLQSATLYRRIEGLWAGVVSGVQSRD